MSEADVRAKAEKLVAGAYLVSPSSEEQTLIEDLCETIEALLEREREIVSFMDNMPAPQGFDARNVLEIHRSWRDAGMLGTTGEAGEGEK